MHSVESSTYSSATPTSTAAGGSTLEERRGGEVRGQQGGEPLLPEDIGRDTASALIEEIVKVCCVILGSP